MAEFINFHNWSDVRDDLFGCLQAAWSYAHACYKGGFDVNIPALMRCFAKLDKFWQEHRSRLPESTKISSNFKKC